MGVFLDSLLFFLPACLGPQKAVGKEIWQQATHLYGSFALQRGLAAGEVVEDLQLLREVILKLLLEGPLGELKDRDFQKDFLALNKVLDLGVVRASIAYVDDLFFAHLQGSGVFEGVTSEVEEEMYRQLDTFRRELGTSSLKLPSHRSSNDQE